jgi:EpsD family peptidyl-prolyl cis-trans isomerase
MTNPLNYLGISVSVIAIASSLTLSGCGKEEHKKAASQVVAKVNGDEISVHQVNFILTRTPGINPENAEQAKKDILAKLIDQQLAIQQAEATKLDRDPGVMQSIEAARRDILARAYFEKVAAGQAKPGAEEARKYYADHPELFARRRIYNLQEIVVASAHLAEVQQLVAQNKSMQDIAGSLKARNIQFSAMGGVRPAEQLPMFAAARLAQAKDGQTVIIEAPENVMIEHIAATREQPIPEAEALPKIEQFLTSQRNFEAIASDMKSLRAKAKIDQVGDIPVTAAASAAATPPAAPPAAGGMDAGNVAKGVAGLK